MVGSLHLFIAFVAKGKDLDMGWFHTKNPEGHGLQEEDVDWGWTEIVQCRIRDKRDG